jgi:hypothetical protein
MKIAPVDQRDFDRCVLQRLSGGKPTESAADNHDARCLFCFWIRPIYICLLDDNFTQSQGSEDLISTIILDTVPD